VAINHPGAEGTGKEGKNVDQKDQIKQNDENRNQTAGMRLPNILLEGETAWLSSVVIL